VKLRRILLALAVAGCVSVVGLLAGLVTNVASAQQQWPGWLEVLRRHPWQSLVVLAVVTALLAAVVGRLPDRDRQGAARTGGLDLAGTADRLAIAVYGQWEAEARRRQLYDPYAMPVSWRPADPSLFPDWSVLVRLATAGPGWPRSSAGGWAAGPAELAGGDDDLVEVLGRVPTGRLVVLGEPGAGKTMLLVRLVLDLLRDRRPGEQVPLLLPLASWNPDDQDLDGWIERWLITENPALAEPVPGGAGISRARALVDAGLITAVLDGLDEIPAATRGAAIARINEAMRPGLRLVLAARTADYRAAVSSPDGLGVQLAGAAGVELCPLGAGVVADYLKDSAGGPAAAARWVPVISILTVNGQTPLAMALSTPLMAALARASYNPRPRETLAAIPDPIELLDQRRFPDRKAIEQHLFDRFIPAVYRSPLSPSRRFECSAEQAERWLVFLARDLEWRQAHMTDLAWWELRGAAPRTLPAISVGLLVGIAGALGLSFPSKRYQLGLGYGCGLVVAVLVGLAACRWVRTGRQGFTAALIGGLIGGLFGALVGLAAFVPGVGRNLLSATLAGGLAFAFIVTPLLRFAASLAGAFAGQIALIFLTNSAVVHRIGATHGRVAVLSTGIGWGLAAAVGVALSSRPIPAQGGRWSAIGIACGLATGLTAGVVAGLGAGSSAGLAVGILATLTGGYAGGRVFEVAAPDLTKATTPRTVLARDRGAFCSSGPGIGLAIALGFGLATALGRNPTDGLPTGSRAAVGVGLASFVAAGLVIGFIQASWGSFVLARAWLAASRRLPWRLMTFLDDAHVLGVLRQAGPFYQFRHAELQRRLAANRVPAKPSRPGRNTSGILPGSPAGRSGRMKPRATDTPDAACPSSAGQTHAT
jgi:hypothetical protein